MDKQNKKQGINAETVTIKIPKKDLEELDELFSNQMCCEKQVETAIKTELFNLGFHP